MHQAEPLFPRTFFGRLQLAGESLFLMCVGVYSLFNWPPAGVVRQGLWTDIFLVLLLEIMIAMIPFAFLGLCWAIAAPEWIRTFLMRAFHHVNVFVCLFVLFGLLGMIAGVLGWW